MATRALDVIAIGEAMVEFNQTDPSRPSYVQGFGGDTSNAMIAVARSGGRAGYVTRVGNDQFGDMLMALWRREGIDVRGVAVDPEAPTGLYFVSHGPTGHSFTYRRAGSAASRLTPDEVPLELIAKSHALHISGISQAISPTAAAAVERAMAAARDAGTLISYDPNLRPALWSIDRARDVIHTTVPQADILLPSLEDAAALAGIDDADAVVDAYLAMGPSIVALTLGAQGALVATAARRLRVAVDSSNFRDATGAGDVFDGAFLAEYLRTGDPFRAGRYAVAAAGLATQEYGAVDPTPRRDAIEARLTATTR